MLKTYIFRCQTALHPDYHQQILQQQRSLHSTMHAVKLQTNPISSWTGRNNSHAEIISRRFPFVRIKTISGPPAESTHIYKAFLERFGFSTLGQHHLKLDLGVIIVFQCDRGERTTGIDFFHFLDVIPHFFLSKASRKRTSS